MSKVRIVFIIIFSIVIYSAVSAQSYTASHSATVQVNKVSAINVISTNNVNISNSVDYNIGTSVDNFWTVQVDANSTWQVTVNATTANFLPITVNTVPISILSFRKNGSLTWLPLTSNAQVVATGNKGDNATVGNSFGVDLKIVPTLEYEPGTYTLSIVFTSTAL
jgi:hypothetical protein